jgi:hypothetical protein
MLAPGVISRLCGVPLVIAASALFSGCEQALLEPTEDAVVRLEDPAATLCAEECLDVRRVGVVTPNDFQARVYLVFDLTAAAIDPPITSIASAKLRLNNCSACSPPGALVRVHEVTESWGCLGAIAPPISWSFQPSFASTPIDQAPCQDGVIEFDITPAAQAWAANPAQNFGVVLTVDEAATPNQSASFWSSEAPDQALRPSLDVRY